MRSLFFILYIVLSFNVLATDRVVIVVSPTGNDGASGEVTRPLKTIAAALDKAKRISHDIPIEIQLRKGCYELDRTLEISRNNVLLTAFNNEQVSISGGRKLAIQMLKKVKDKAVSNRIQPEYHQYIREIDFGKLNIPFEGLHATGFGRPTQSAWTEVYINGNPLRIARWPNDSTVAIQKVYESGISTNGEYTDFPVFGYGENRPNKWKNVTDLWISGYFAHGYADDMIRVERIDTLQKKIHTAQHTLYGFMSGAAWRRWMALNLLEELDSSGEFVLDTQLKKMYLFMPHEKVNEINVSCLDAPLLAIENCRNVRVEGLIFEYGRQMGIYLENTHDVLIKECVVRNMGGVGISVGKGTFKQENTEGHKYGGKAVSREIGDLMGRMYEDILFNRQGGTNNGIVDCYIYQTGAGGISLGGGNRATLTPAGNYVENCRIYNYNRIEKSYRPGIWIDGVGNRVSGCSIHDAPSMAILFHGNDHLIELCDITRVCNEVDDQGAIYYGRDPSELGNVIRYCYFHELSPKHRVTATYHDDGACGAEVYGNIYYKAGSIPVLIGGGHQNHYKNNIFVTSPVAIRVDNRMQNWGKDMVAKGGIIDQRLETVKFDSPPYSEAYPWLPTYWDSTPSYPKGNVVEGNLFYQIGNVIGGRTEWLEMNNNWITSTNPGWIDPSDPLKGFEVGAPIYRMIKDFPVLPFSKIGTTLPLH
ncbi:MAG: right-handed parallel beta-helix repeat-containing protein [Parabacteroides sp.]|nr:right-handed parallel beta-helix repeat-containing protein [Parabacteroides sp.]